MAEVQLQITARFLSIAADIVYAAGLQQLIHSQGTCYKLFIVFPQILLCTANTDSPDLQQAVAAALEAASAIVLGPVSKDPWLVIMFACFAGTITTTAVLFYLAFRGFDADYVTSDVVATDGNMDQGQNDDPEAGAPARETGESDSHCEEKAIRIKTAEVPL